MDINTCIDCNLQKLIALFLKDRNICKDCNNLRRRLNYKSNPEIRAKLIQDATKFKQAKLEIRRAAEAKRIQELEEKIGKENTICKYCEEVKPKTRFRHNRKKCADCERDEPIDKFKRNIRSRIYIALKAKKTYHTIEYLGCTAQNYLEWLQYKNPQYTLNNRGIEWHIDHVVPLSRFNLDDIDEQMIAFNWCNTMPLSPSENLAKNNKIIPEQIEIHLNNLIEYHKEKNIELPQKFIDLYRNTAKLRGYP